jgi:DNA-binding transcriptional ArsR family regulator
MIPRINAGKTAGGLRCHEGRSETMASNSSQTTQERPGIGGFGEIDVETLREVTESPHENELEELSTETVFTVVKNRRRRDVLRYLREHDGETTLSDVAEHIAADENDISRQALSSDQRKRVYIALYQCHLPKMDDAGVVDFDKDRGDIVLRDRADRLFRYIDMESSMEAEEEGGRSPAAANLALATVVAAAVAGHLASLPLLGGLSPQFFALLAAGAAVVIAGVSYAAERWDAFDRQASNS